MKFYELLRHVMSLLFFVIFTNLAAEVPPINQDKKPAAGYYVVVAAYYSNGAEYAEKYATTFEEKGYNGQFAFFPEKQMFLVHLNHYTDFDEAIGIMRNVRKEGVKDDAWVYVYRPEDIPTVAESTQESNPVKDAKPDSNNTLQTSDKQVPDTETETEQEPVSTDKSDSTGISLEPEPQPEPDPDPEPEPEPEPDPYEGKQAVFFDLYQGVSNEILTGQIQIIDPEKARVVTLLNANEWHHIDNPSNNHQEVQLVADFFGYRKISHVINLEDPLADSTDYFVELKGDSILVDFEMVRYHKGDIFTMYNVYFITHSAIMRPESIYELDQLLAMFQENPSLEIILHGHTNGNAKGDMRYKPEPDINFFSTAGAQEKTASAKVLSEERAMVVKRYLVHKGISPSRIQVKGWGGKRMLYKKTDPQAIKNVRVEIEIVNE